MKKNGLKTYLLFAFMMPLNLLADWQTNMTRGVTPVSKDIYDLHMIIFWICVAIAIAVFGVLIYALIFHRKSRGAVAATFHEHPALEILWAIIPFLILVTMAIPATKVLIRMDDTTEAGVTIKVTGLQWKWQYEYLDEGLSFFSNLATPIEQIKGQAPKGKWYLLEVDNPVVVPVNTKVRILVTAGDVIHSWWVPALGVKRDAVPGFIHEAWFKIEKAGTYRGQCAELCGVNHAYMPIVVEAVSQADYQAWIQDKRIEKIKKESLSAKQWTKAELMKEGKLVYDKFCAACHKASGEGMPPVYPALKSSSVAVGGSIDRHIDIVLWGVQGSAMQAFHKQLTDAEIAAVVTYERNAFDNNTGDLTQPSDVKLLRAKQS